MPSLQIVEGADAARSSVLKRDPFGAPELSDALQQSIEELWGEPLSAADHVARILEEVATKGDEAVTRLSQRFDGSSYEAIEVSREEITAAFALVPPEQIDAIEFATNRVRHYHREQKQYDAQPCQYAHQEHIFSTFNPTNHHAISNYLLFRQVAPRQELSPAPDLPSPETSL